MKRRDADGFPLSFELPLKDALAFEQEVERLKREKQKPFRGAAPGARVSVINRRWVAS
jgi:hypothetical protein